MKIAIGSDERTHLTDFVVHDLQAQKHEVLLFGPLAENDPEGDWPLVSSHVAEAVASGQADQGIVFCWTGTGAAIAANKVPGVHAVCVQDPYTDERAVASNNAQVITFGSQITGPAVAEKLVDVWLASEFQGGRSAPKVAKIDSLDEKYRV